MEETEKETPEQEKKELLKEILANIQIDIEAEKDNHKEMLDDLKFCTLDQWPVELRASRENDLNGARPCLTVDLTNQYITQVVNDMRQNKPGIKMRPDNDEAAVETAEVHQGLVRHIEDKSSATIAYENAGEWAVKTGRGYFRIITEYIDGSFDQEPRIMPIEDAFSVFLGPHIMPDGSDAKRGTIVTALPADEFKRQFPKAKSESSDFEGLGEFRQTWREEKTITIAEHFYTDYKETELFFLKNGQSVYKNKFDGLETDIVKRRSATIETVKWCKLSGVEILEEREWLGKYIPIIKVIGKHSVIEGKHIYWGLVRPIKDSLRMYNYWISAITEKIGLAPKAPFIMSAGQVEGFEEQWKKANTENRAYLTYNTEDVNGNAIPAPQRVQPAPVEVAMVQMMGIIENQVRMALGMYKASVGDAASQQSGKALGLLQRESDTGTFHFSDNLAYSICYAGRILLDLNPKLMDTKRVIRILGDDGTSKSATIDPQQQQSARQIQTLNGIKSIYNLGVGEYTVSVTIGPSYTTKRMEAASVFTELARSAQDPGAAAVLNYLTIKNSDVTSSDEAIVMLKALLPPQALQAEEQGPVPPQVAAQMQQMQHHLHLLQEAGQKLSEENQTLKSGIQVNMAKISVDSDAKLQAIELDKKVVQEKANLAREEFEFNKQLELDKAIHEIDLAERKAEATHKQTMDKMNFDMNCKMHEMNKQTEMENEVEGEKVMPQVMQTMETLISQFTAVIEDQNKFQIELVNIMNKPKKIIVNKDSSGSLIGATSTTVQ